MFRKTFTKPLPTGAEIFVRLTTLGHQNVAQNQRGVLFGGTDNQRITKSCDEAQPLRERQADIPLLVAYFIERYARKMGKQIRGITTQSLELLASYPWPGNIRELQNVIERSVIVCDTETFTVDASWLSRASPPPPAASRPLLRRPAAQEKALIEAVLAETRGRVSGPSGAAAKLGLPPSTLDSKIRALQINKHRFKTDAR